MLNVRFLIKKSAPGFPYLLWKSILDRGLCNQICILPKVSKRRNKKTRNIPVMKSMLSVLRVCYWYKYANYLSLYIRNGDNFVNKSLMIFQNKTLKCIKWQKNNNNRFSLVLVFKVDPKKMIFSYYSNNMLEIESKHFKVYFNFFLP